MRYLDILDLARVHAVRLCSRPPVSTSDPFLRHLMPAEETPDRKNFLQHQENDNAKFHIRACLDQHLIMIRSWEVLSDHVRSRT